MPTPATPRPTIDPRDPDATRALLAEVAALPSAEARAARYMALRTAIDRALAEVDVRDDLHDAPDMVDAYDATLTTSEGEGSVRIAGVELQCADILKECDQTAYDTGLNDRIDAIASDMSDAEKARRFDWYAEHVTLAEEAGDLAETAEQEADAEKAKP